MSRVVKEYDERYAEFLDVAQELFYQKGYEPTSVQEIIRRVQVAKGTFYHYFESKAALLDALVARMIEQTLAALQPLIDDASLDALTKFQQFFAATGNWKAANRDFLVEMMQVLYRDENVLLRTKMEAAAIALTAPLLAQIIEQGVAEKHFSVAHPTEAAEIVLTMGRACSNALVALLLTKQWDADARAAVERKLCAYERSIERILGADEDSLQLIAPDVLDVWLPMREAQSHDEGPVG